MAVGDGGFSTRPMGFDKNEVNEYISSLRKKMQEIEAEKKVNDAKTAEALKTAETADERVQAAVKAGEEKAAELELKLTTERRNAEVLQEQVDDLKAKLNAEKQKMTDMLKTGKGVNEEAKNAYTEVIEKANQDAKEIIEAAKKSAESIVSDAETRRADSDKKLADFMAMFREKAEAMNALYASIGEYAAALLGTSPVGGIAPTKIEVPNFDNIAKEMEAAFEEPKQPEAAPEEPAPAEEAETELPEEQPAEEPAEAPAEEPAAEPAPEEEPEELLENAFDGDWGGNEIAQNIENTEKPEKAAVPLVNPDSKDDLFGDLFGSADMSEDGEKQQEDDEMVSEVAPLDNSAHAKPSFDHDFGSDLIAQTMPSSNLTNDIDSSIIDAVKKAEEKFAVKPTAPDSVKDFDMEAEDSAASDEDELMKALRDAEASLGMLGAAIDTPEPEPEQEKASPKIDMSDPWADLQAQLEAMEKAGNFGDDGSSAADNAEPAPAPEAAKDPEAPSADDASIWNFGGGSSEDSSDDDMSSDAFGGFGGF